VILDLGSFTRRGLMVDHVYLAETWGGGGGCRAHKEQRVQDLAEVAQNNNEIVGHIRALQ